MKRTGRLLKPVTSKLPGSDKHTQHRPGTRCQYERHSQQAGVFVLYFGKQYALVNAVDLPEIVEQWPL